MITNFIVVECKVRFIGKPPCILSEALNISIEKWKFILHHVSETGRIVADGGPTTCGLCMMFNQVRPLCYGCPIDSSGYTGCRGTPYTGYLAARATEDYKVALETAQREIDFLEGLKVKYESKRILPVV